MLTKKEVRAAMLRKLKESSLGNGDLKKLGVQCFTAEEVAAKVTTLHVTHPGAGFVLPYYDLQGEYAKFFRFRYLEQPKRNGFASLATHKELRYTQPPGMAPKVYFSPLWDWEAHFANQDPKVRWLMITEGELKANCACKMELPTLALGGVWNFMSKNDNVPLIHDLAQLPLKDYLVYIVFDSDATTNPDVLRAENALMRQLLDREARPYIVRIPALEQGKKTGLDDFLVAQGKQQFQKLLVEAEEYEPSAAMHQLNEEVIYLHDNNTVLELKTRNRWRPKDFSQGVYATRTHTIAEPAGKRGEVKMKVLRTAEEWIKWPGRGEVLNVTYRPGAPLIVDQQYNCWQGWGCTAAEGSTKYWNALMDYIFKGEADEHKKWFDQWCAYPLQNPGAKLITAPVFWGVDQGTGKTLIGHTLGRIYGANFSEIDSTVLNSAYNEWAQYKQFVLGDEITGEELGGKRRVTLDTLKNLTTRQKIYMNPKYVSSYYLPDCINYIFTSNHPDAFRLEDQDRRFAIFEVKGPPLPKEFYYCYDRWYKSDEGIAALFYKLLHVNLEGFSPYAEAPATKAKLEMISDSRSDLGAWIATLRQVELIKEKRTLWTAKELHAAYLAQGGSERVTINGLGRELKRQGYLKALDGTPIWTGLGPQKLWVIGDIGKIRRPEQFAKLFNEEHSGAIQLRARMVPITEQK